MSKKQFKKLPTQKNKNNIQDKISRVFIILARVNKGDCPTVNDLAKACKVTERSVYRYIKMINDVSIDGFYPLEITYDEAEGGYRFVNPNALGLVNLKSEEIALVAALSDMTSKLGRPVKGYFQGVLGKLFPHPKDGGAGAPGSVLGFKMPELAVDIPMENFELVYRAIRRQNQLRIRYSPVNSEEKTERVIDPYGLVYYDGIWFLYAYCNLRKDFRWFALDRIEEVFTWPHNFARPEGFDLEAELKKTLGLWGGKQTRVTVRFSPEVAEVIKRKKAWFSDETRTDLPGGGVELAFTVNGTTELKWWLYSWLPHVKVVKPVKLKKEFERDLRKALSLHQ